MRCDPFVPRISTGFQKGKKVFLLQTRLLIADETQSLDLLGKVAGFSQHAGVAVKGEMRSDTKCAAGTQTIL